MFSEYATTQEKGVVFTQPVSSPHSFSETSYAFHLGAYYMRSKEMRPSG